MMMHMPMDIAPTSMASAVLCSCTISFHQVVRRHLIDDDERQDEDQQTEPANITAFQM